MRSLILFFLLFTSLYSQQFVVHVSNSGNSSRDTACSKALYTPEVSIKCKYGNVDPEMIIPDTVRDKIDPGIIIPDTVRYKMDPEIRVNMSSSLQKLKITVYTLQKDNNGKDKLKEANTDELLKYSNLAASSRPPIQDGYYILVKNQWKPYRYIID